MVNMSVYKRAVSNRQKDDNMNKTNENNITEAEATHSHPEINIRHLHLSNTLTVSNTLWQHSVIWKTNTWQYSRGSVTLGQHLIVMKINTFVFYQKTFILTTWQ